MKKQNQKVKHQLDKELNSLHFSKYEKVLESTHPKSFNQRLNSYWNKEVEIPVIPLIVTASLLFTTITLKDLMQTNSSYQADREIIEFAGYAYWKDEYEKAVNRYENKGEN